MLFYIYIVINFLQVFYPNLYVNLFTNDVPRRKNVRKRKFLAEKGGNGRLSASKTCQNGRFLQKKIFIVRANDEYLTVNS